MPLGTSHVETGWLRDLNGERALHRDDGGRWRLEMSLLVRWRSRNLVGKRVQIVGVRDGFDLLAVREVRPI